MSLHLVNAYTSSNLGDAAIYETLVQLGGAAGTACHAGHEHLQRVRGLHAAQALGAAKAYVSVGGDIFNNARPWLVTRRFLAHLHELHQLPSNRTFLFGQTIPASCRGLAFASLAMVLRGLSSVTVRDAHSHARLCAAGVRAALSYDLAFAYRPGPNVWQAARALFDAANVDPLRSVILSVRGFDRMYPHDSNEFLQRMATLAKGLRSRGHQVCLVVQAAQAGGADCDRTAAEVLRALTPELRVLDPFALPAPHHPLDALVGALALARGAVAVRFHTAVLRLLMGRVPYSLHYSTKGVDLANRLRLPGQALQAFDPQGALADIESSFDRAYDVTPQSQDVRQRFEAAYAAARGVPAQASLGHPSAA